MKSLRYKKGLPEITLYEDGSKARTSFPKDWHKYFKGKKYEYQPWRGNDVTMRAHANRVYLTAAGNISKKNNGRKLKNKFNQYTKTFHIDPRIVKKM